jgi:hypothetical protein
MADGGAEGLGSWEDSAGDVLVCVWYVHFCCESVGYSMGTQWLAVETKEYAHCEFEDFD